MAKRTSINIYANFDAYYYTFYVLGIVRLFKNEQLIFSNQDFPDLPSDCFAFVTDQNKRIFIDAVDTSSINIDAARWCSVYGKVNYSSKFIPSDIFQKIKPIGPSFGIRLWPVIKAGFLACSSYLVCRTRIKDFRLHFANYWRQYRYRLPESLYVYNPPEKDYIFFL